jgi:NAD(P)-dependent dehydrogenase (short-subunit alcohol dehydrogenase family)
MLVIGPAGRLARATAHTARARGARVALAAPDGGEDLGARESPCPSVDVRSESVADEMFDHAATLLPGLDAVIVVSTIPPLGAIHELSHRQWCERVGEPLRRVFWLVRRAIEGFLADGVAGRLVLVAECADEVHGTNAVVTTALESLVRSVTREYGRRGLACNLVVRTDASETSHTVEQVLFLTSPAASFVNGEALVVR